MFNTDINGLSLRIAEKGDIELILEFIKALALYEKLSHEVVATEDLLEEWLFDKKKAEVIIAEYKGEPVGFALFFHNFSTFLGKSGIYLEDLFIKEEFRLRGFGAELLKFLARLTLNRGCGRLEWSCLKWNKASIAFYKSKGAVEMEEWTTFRIAGDKLLEFAKISGDDIGGAL